ncbi:MAG: glutathione S-transferase family protein [Proteobacteria bacterium]|nr:glutathione S-transferase family protein [Pseudomonadota bacterium]
MGFLINGEWHDKWRDTEAKDGSFVRPDAKIRNWITATGEPGPSGHGGFKAEAGRYHLYIADSCPWAHRTMIFRLLKGLEDMVSVSVVNAISGANGWTFEAGHGVVPDPEFSAAYLYEIYQHSDSGYTGQVTVPTLWDKTQKKLVSNESGEIIRMFNSAFDDIGALEGDYYPEQLRAEIDAVNELVYGAINNGVYRVGFATSQQAYEDAYNKLFAALDQLEDRLASRTYLVGEQLTEADWRLFTTLVRFDYVYYGAFRCNKRRIVDYPHLWQFVRDLYKMPGIADTIDAWSIKAHYYASGKLLKQTQIVPLGPEIDYLDEPST